MECVSLHRPDREQQLMPVWELPLQTTNYHRPLRNPEKYETINVVSDGWLKALLPLWGVLLICLVPLKSTVLIWDLGSITVQFLGKSSRLRFTNPSQDDKLQFGISQKATCIKTTKCLLILKACPSYSTPTIQHVPPDDSWDGLHTAKTQI